MRHLLVALALMLGLASQAHAVIAETYLTHGNGVLSGSPLAITSASVTPVAGQLILVWTGDTSNNATCISGTNGLNTTWTRITEQGANGGTLALWHGVASSSTAGTLTITAAGSGFPICSPGGGADHVSWVIVQFAGVDQTTSEGVRQSAITFDNASVTSKAVTLAAFGSAKNATVYGALQKANNTTFTPAAGYSSVTDASAGSGTLGVSVKPTADTGPTGTFGAAAAIVATAAELVTATTSPRRHRVNIQ